MAETDDDMVVGGNVEVDTINEKTADAGVTVDGVLLKDSKIVATAIDINGASDLGAPASGDEILVSDITDSSTVKKSDLATAVQNAGATMNADTDVSANGWVIDEDNMASDDNTKVPTQQSVVAYVIAYVASALATAFGAIAAHLLPATTDTYNLGSASKTWDEVHAHEYKQYEDRELTGGEPFQTSSTSSGQTIGSLATVTGYAYHVRAYVTGYDSAGGEWSEEIVGTFKNLGGTVTQGGSTTQVHPSSSALAIAFAISGTTIDVDITPATANLTNWRVNFDYQTVPLAV